MAESGLHQQVQRSLDHLLVSAIQNLAAMVDNEDIRGRLRNVRGTGTEHIVLPGRLNACPDISFTELLPAAFVQRDIPSLVGEIC